MNGCQCCNTTYLRVKDRLTGGQVPRHSVSMSSSSIYPVNAADSESSSTRQRHGSSRVDPKRMIHLLRLLGSCAFEDLRVKTPICLCTEDEV